MKRNFLICSFVLFFSTSAVFGQDIPQSQVPSLIVNSFQQAYPKAYDIEWEMDGEMYKVEFETGLTGSDHDAWYDKTGKLVRHKEKISKSDLPQKVTAKINNDYKGYQVDDVKKLTEGSKVTYTLELKTHTEEWKIALDPDGNILSKVAD